MPRFLLPLVLILSTCRTTNSSIKDAELSPVNIAVVSAVLWQTADDNVHYGSCPIGTNPVNRKCQGLQEKSLMPAAEYKDKLSAAIVELSGGSTPLNAKDQKDFDSIVASLQAGSDVIFDEGEQRFTLAQAPFIGLGIAYRIIPLEGIGQCNSTIVMQQLKFKIKGQYQEFVITKEVDEKQVEGTLLGKDALAVSSSSSHSTNSLKTGLVPNPRHWEGWSPRSFLDNNLKATRLEYLEIRLKLPLTLSGIQFSGPPSNQICSVKSFRIEAMRAGGSFAPVVNGEWTDITWSAANIKNFEW